MGSFVGPEPLDHGLTDDHDAGCVGGIPLVELPASDERNTRGSEVSGIVTIAVLLTNAYLFWPIFTLNDGPFYSETYEGDISQTLLFLGTAHGRTSRYDDAIAVLERAASVGGRTPMQLSVLGWAYGEAGRSEDARRILGELQAKSEEAYVSPIFFVYAHIDATSWSKRSSIRESLPGTQSIDDLLAR